MRSGRAIKEKEKSAKARFSVLPFQDALAEHNLFLNKKKITTLQINTGLLCNQTCQHCHLEAGPDRKELMSTETMEQVMALTGGGDFKTIDITGGAPELHPQIGNFIEKLSPYCSELIFRTNLTALLQKGEPLFDILKANGVTVTASFPSLNEIQTASVRGKENFRISIDALKRLNALDYGKQGSGLELNLVVNPTGAFLPPPQAELEKRFHNILYRKWGIVFNRLFSLANVPLGRFRNWLIRSNNFDAYIKKLATAFNPNTIAGLMCRSILSVAWDGYLYDCDFNQAANLPMGKQRVHISEIKTALQPKGAIALGEHCYTCTAGSGFT